MCSRLCEHSGAFSREKPPAGVTRILHRVVRGAMSAEGTFLVDAVESMSASK